MRSMKGGLWNSGEALFSDTLICGPQEVMLLGRLRKYGLDGGSKSLVVGAQL